MDKIDKLDKKILGILSANARLPFKDVAAECGVSRAAIHQRVQHLIENGVITGSSFEINPKALGYSTCTYVGMDLERGSMYRDVVNRLLSIPQVVECHFTTGQALRQGQRATDGPHQRAAAEHPRCGEYRDADLPGGECSPRDTH